MKKKKNRILIKLESSEKTGYFYITTKNKKSKDKKLSVKKYDPKLRRHVIFNEVKIK